MDESAASSEENRSFYDSSIFGNWNNNKELVNKIKRRLSTLNLPSAVVGVVSRDVKGLIFTGGVLLEKNQTRTRFILLVLLLRFSLDY